MDKVIFLTASETSRRFLRIYSYSKKFIGAVDVSFCFILGFFFFNFSEKD